MADPSSTDVIRAALAGRRDPDDAGEAFERLYARYSPRLHSYIRLKLGSSLRTRLESRDILQATLLKSFDRFGEFRGTDGRSLMAWLAKIAEREIGDRADYYQRQRRDPRRETPLEDDSQRDDGSARADVPARVRSALSQVILDEQVDQLEAAIESLSDAHRQIILLRKFEDLSFGEIARRLGKSEDACRMLFARAMTALTLKLAGSRTT
jgi:RNA polymerase sigma-70 factor (ECF subfamily)